MILDSGENLKTNQASALSGNFQFEERFRKLRKLIEEASVKVTQVVDEINHIKEESIRIKEETEKIVSGLKDDVNCNKSYDSRWKFTPTDEEVERIIKALDDLDFGGLDGIGIRCTSLYCSTGNTGGCTSCNNAQGSFCVSCDNSDSTCPSSFGDDSYEEVTCPTGYSGCGLVYTHSTTLPNCTQSQSCVSCDSGNATCTRCDEGGYDSGCSNCQDSYRVLPCTQTSCNDCHGGGYEVTCTSCNSTSNDCTRCQQQNYSEVDGCTSSNSYTTQDGCTRTDTSTRTGIGETCSLGYSYDPWDITHKDCLSNYKSSCLLAEARDSCTSSFNKCGSNQISCANNYSNDPRCVSTQDTKRTCSQNYSQVGDTIYCKSNFTYGDSFTCSSGFASGVGITCDAGYTGGTITCSGGYNSDSVGDKVSCRTSFCDGVQSCSGFWTVTTACSSGYSTAQGVTEGSVCNSGYRDSTWDTNCQSGYSGDYGGIGDQSCHNGFSTGTGTECEFQYGTLCTTCNAGGNIACPECHGATQTNCTSCVSAQSTCDSCNAGLSESCTSCVSEVGCSDCQGCNAGCNENVSCGVSYDGTNCSGGFDSGSGSVCLVSYTPGSECTGGFDDGNTECALLYTSGEVPRCSVDFTSGSVSCDSLYTVVDGKPICEAGDSACGNCLSGLSGCSSCDSGCQSCNVGCQSGYNPTCSGCNTGCQGCDTGCDGCQGCDGGCQSCNTAQCSQCHTASYVPSCGYGEGWCPAGFGCTAGYAPEG